MSSSSDSPPGEVTGFTGRQWLILAAATVVGAALRLWGLGEWSFWVDEGHTWRDATMPLDGEDGFLATQRRFYPVPFLLLRLLLGLGLVGYDEGSVRLPFVLIGIATVPVLALCGRRLVGAWPAVIAACLLAVNPWHVFWSQNARGYGLAMLACALAVHGAHRWHGGRRLFDLLLTFVWIGLAVTSHPAAGMVVVGFVGYLFVRGGFSRQSLLGSGPTIAIAVVVSLFVLPVLIREVSPFTGFMRAKGTPSLVHYVETVAYYFRPAVLLAGLLAMLVAPRALGRDRALFLICMVAVPMLVLAGVSAFVVKVTARYGICTLPVLTWLVALLIVELWRRVRASSLPLALLLPGILVGDSVRLGVAYYTSQHGQRARWREAAEFVTAEAARRGREGVFAVSVNEPTMLYYLRRKHWFQMEQNPHPGFRVQVLLGLTIDGGRDRLGNQLHEPGPEAHLEWLRQRCGPDRLFAVLVTLPELREQDPSGRFEALLQREFELALHLPCWVGPKDESVYVFLPKP
ncbi:MAG: glycosyltransferase family 39 protein [Planctomycetes bacterium]|nr:glycosyltransferase family 39 protein [Planctomycetota bacterium]